MSIKHYRQNRLEIDQEIANQIAPMFEKMENFYVGMKDKLGKPWK